MNLALDEKKIRKGKAVGLPYVGSKKKISKKIVEIIKQNFGTEKTVYDVFGGGGAITAELMINNMDVVYNDLDKTITDMFNRISSQDREWIKTLIVSREEFFIILAKENKTVDDELKLLVNSFGNNRKDYLYGKGLSDIKYKLAVEILENSRSLKYDFSNYSQTKIYIENVFNNEKTFKKRIDNRNGRKIMHQLQQFNRLTSIAYIEQLNIYPKTTNEDYHYFSDVKNSILYLDPPYENSENGSYTSQIDYQDFYDWAVQMSKNNIVLLSSYEVSDNRFECVYEFKTARSTFQNGGPGSRHEKLFMVKL
ncbi:DNA adenine methylase [Leuconostoc lactis]|uniref:DNA adenine methylase n=1 Tax=Leuconostoc lactis TaxID=1246 RepID=UPI003D6C2997